MHIGKVIADYRYINRIGVRSLAKEIGISPATLNRVELGNGFDGETMAKIMVWLFAPATERRQRKA